MRREDINMDEVLQYLGQRKSPTINQNLDEVNYIKDVLINTYSPEHYAQRSYTIFEERRSLLTATLYNLIIKMKELPTVQQFTEVYLEENGHLPDLQAERYFSNLGYLSLVIDLHFYFVLRDSKLFDSVTIDYEYDLKSYTDIILRKSDQVLGLQLFAGSEQSEQGKRLQLAYDKTARSYPIHLFSRKSKGGKREVLETKSGAKIELYSEVDAGYISKKLENQQEKVMDDFNEETFNMPMDLFDRVPSLSKKELPPLQANVYDKALEQAKHSILFLGKQVVQQMPADFKDKAKVYGVGLHYFDIEPILLPKELNKTRFIIDGKWKNEYVKDDLYKKMREHFNKVQCNILQYEVEHFNDTRDLMVAAGAGSGKTHTLVSRTLFLLNTGVVKSIKEIAMITFTNEAADNMRIKLAERFIELFRQTGKFKYRIYLEELQEMRISTIPAFAKYILQQFGQFIGLGADVRISNLTMDRRDIIETALDEEVNQIGGISIFEKLPHYELIKFIEFIWEKVEQKGASMQDFQDSTEDQQLFTLLLNTLKNAEESFSKIKIEKNTVTLADLTGLLQDLIEQHVPLDRLKKRFSYLFIDEFQDTDNAQIDFIGEIALQAKIPLLVVGDVKQSIYRFRGANSTAFNLLSTNLKKEGREVHDVSLRYNYRTTKALLEQMETVFDLWRRGDWLPKKEDSMTATGQNSDFVGKRAYDTFSGQLKEVDLLRYYEELKAVSKNDEKQPTLAILVRRNSEALEMAQLLQQMKKNNDIVYDVQLEGTLFQSKAAKDLLLLLDSWIAFDDEVTLYAFSETFFCKPTQKEMVVQKINGHYEVTKDAVTHFPQAWEEALEQLKFNPANLVLNEFLAKVPYMDNMKEEGLADYKSSKYQLNLYKILMMLYSSLNEQTDVLAMYEWLANQVSTNTTDDEAQLESTDFAIPMIKVMTVHKSKGLEFHTVVIPFTQTKIIGREPQFEKEKVDFNQPPFKNKNPKYNMITYKNVLVHANQEKKGLAWLYARKKDAVTFFSMTPNYFDLKEKEDEESAREEARILYVAMTRAEKRCFIFGIKERDKQSYTEVPGKWANLVAMEEK